MLNYLIIVSIGWSIAAIAKVIYHNIYVATWLHERKDYSFLDRLFISISIIYFMYEGFYFLGRLVNG